MAERHQMEQVGKQSPEMAGLVFWGHLASRDVITNDGRKVGVARGILIASDWTIPEIVVEVNRNILDEVGIEQKHKIDQCRPGEPIDQLCRGRRRRGAAEHRPRWAEGKGPGLRGTEMNGHET